MHHFFDESRCKSRAESSFAYDLTGFRKNTLSILDVLVRQAF
jgi:hypothetical protein